MPNVLELDYLDTASYMGFQSAMEVDIVSFRPVVQLRLSEKFIDLTRLINRVSRFSGLYSRYQVQNSIHRPAGLSNNSVVFLQVLESEHLIRYSDGLRPRRRGLYSGSARFFSSPQRPHRFWCPPSPLSGTLSRG
jgi:hypothetical protein